MFAKQSRLLCKSLRGKCRVYFIYIAWEVIANLYAQLVAKSIPTQCFIFVGAQGIGLSNTSLVQKCYIFECEFCSLLLLLN